VKKTIAKIKKKMKPKMKIMPDKAIKMDGKPFVGRHTTG
jgi:hypothetical protein